MTYYLATNPMIAAYKESDLFGKGIFLSLLGLSIITWLIFLYKMWLTQNVRKNANKLQYIFHKKKLNPLGIDLTSFPVSDEVPHPFLEIYRSLQANTLELLSKNQPFCSSKGGNDSVYLSASDMDLIQAHVFTTISSQSKRLEKNLFILSTIVSLAPFLGLLGTVWGILETFTQLQQRSGGAANELVMGGLSMALGTTVLGLVVAIPALIAYNFLKSTLDHLTTEMEDFSNVLIASVEMQYRKVDVLN